MLGERGVWLGADAKRRRVRRAQRRMGLFETPQLPKELVVLLIGKGRTIEDVVVVIRSLNLLAQRRGPRREGGIQR